MPKNYRARRFITPPPATKHATDYQRMFRYLSCDVAMLPFRRLRILDHRGEGGFQFLAFGLPKFCQPVAVESL